MFEGLRYEFALRQLQKEKRRTRAWYADADSKLLKEPKNLEELQNLTDVELHDMQVIRDKISRVQTTFWRDEAERYLLPMPAFKTDSGDSWEQAATAIRYQLKPAAIAELRLAIRREKKDRRDGWLPLASLAVGVMGCLVAIIALLAK